MDWSRRHMNLWRRNMNWRRGDVDWRLRDVNVMNLSSSSASATSRPSVTVCLWYLDKGWRGFHFETFLTRNFTTCYAWNFKAGCFLRALADRPVCVEAYVLVLPCAVPVGQGAEVSASSSTPRDVEADVLLRRWLTFRLIHSEALPRRLLLAGVDNPVLALLLGLHLGHANTLLLGRQRALLACQRLALMGCCLTLAAGL